MPGATIEDAVRSVLGNVEALSLDDLRKAIIRIEAMQVLHPAAIDEALECVDVLSAGSPSLLHLNENTRAALAKWRRSARQP